MTAGAKSLVELFALMAAQGTVLAVLGFFIVRGGRLRPGWQAAVWLVVLAKFVLPWGPAMPWSLADLFAALRTHADAGAVVVAPGTAAPAAVAAASMWWLVIAAAWLVGASAVVARAVIGHVRVLSAARRASPAPAHARQVLAAVTRRPPLVVVGDPAIGPYVVGVVRPIIVIPPALLEDPALLRAALLHEMAHVRRRDALGRILQVAANAMFFFWPVVRLVSRRLDLAREAACDAWAIEASAVSRPAYARLLLRMAQLRTVQAASLAAPCGLDARVAAVLGPPARARLGATHRIALVAWGALALGGARSAAARGEHTVCKYTPQLAEALRQAHPEADRDGDGVLSRDEACEFQAELRLRVETPLPSDAVSTPLDASLLTEPLCCNCDRGAENSAPWITKRSDACQSDEGVSR
jgi:beta-lactamase regulating signal transducer with metallopeptidase domain